MRITAKMAVTMAALAALALGGAGQQQRGRQAPAPSMADHLPEDQKLDTLVSEMLAAWQLGDVELMRNYYADEVSVVSGAFEPPLLGWAAYAQAYRRQRERVQSVAVMERTNTLIVLRGNVAWMTYQWTLVAAVDGRNTTVRGHTTLVLEKRDRWRILHNHTSALPEVPPAPGSPPAAAPG